MPLITPGNMFSRGKWEYCKEYDPGDVVKRAGMFFLCINECAGYDPISPTSENFWEALGDGGSGLPGGGVQGQVLTKKTDDDFDAVWDWPNANKYYRGFFRTPAQLIATHPTDEPGAFASVFSTFTIWLWNADTSQWEDTGQSGVYVQTVNGKTGPDVLLNADDIPGVEKLANKNKVNGYAGLDEDAHVLKDHMPMAGGQTGQVWGKKSNADYDMDWIDAGSGVGTHADLPDLLPSGIAAAEANHIDNAKWALVDTIEKARPLKPTNLSPKADETDVLGKPLFVSSPYACPYGTEMYGYQLKIFDMGTTLVYDSGESEASRPMFRLPEELHIGTEYRWTVRYQSQNLQWSEWSDLTKFTTAGDFSAKIFTPGIMIPKEGGVLNSPTPLVVTTPFEATGSLIQADGDFQIATDSLFANVVDSGTGKNAFLGSIELTRGEPYFARANHKATGGQVSQWSYPVSFIVRNLYDGQRVGLVLDSIADWHFTWVDGNFNPIDIDPDYVNRNGIFVGWQSSANIVGGVPQFTDIDGQKMVIIPKFYIRSGKVPDGYFQGKHFWMIDPTPPSQQDIADGWHAHPAFISPAGEVDNFAISAYHIHYADNEAAASTPLAFDNNRHRNHTISQWRQAINRRNSDPANPQKRGWEIVSPYQIYALNLLALIEKGQTTKVMNDLIVPYVWHNGQWQLLNGRWGQYFNTCLAQTPYGYNVIGGFYNNKICAPGNLDFFYQLPRQLSLVTSVQGTHSSFYKKPVALYGPDYGAPEGIYSEDLMIYYDLDDQPSPVPFIPRTDAPNGGLQNVGGGGQVWANSNVWTHGNHGDWGFNAVIATRADGNISTGGTWMIKWPV